MMKPIACVVLAACLSSCGGDTAPAPVASVTITGGNTVVENGTLHLTAVAKDADGNVISGRMVSWRSNNQIQIWVDPDGTLHNMLGPSTATITATVDSVKGTLLVTVTQGTISRIDLQPAVFTAVIDSSFTPLNTVLLDANNKPLVFTGRTATWSSADTTIATVSLLQNIPVVRGVALGSATILAKVDGVTATAMVTVRAAAK